MKKAKNFFKNKVKNLTLKTKKQSKYFKIGFLASFGFLVLNSSPNLRAFAAENRPTANNVTAAPTPTNAPPMVGTKTIIHGLTTSFVFASCSFGAGAILGGLIGICILKVKGKQIFKIS